jgi:Domain of unknown function (DUF4190)
MSDLDRNRPVWGDYEPRPRETAGGAITALVLGIGGIFAVPLIAPALALFFGYRALEEIDRSRGRLGGRGMAQAGVTLGYVGLTIDAFFLALIVFAFG